MIQTKTKKRQIYLLLDNIRSVHNVGSIFRTAEAAGVSKIYCVGTTPTPLDRFGSKRRDLAKVALGAEEMVAWEYSETPDRVLRELQASHFSVIAVEQDEKAVNYRKIKPTNKTLIVFGNETEGVSRQILKKADAIVEIPMNGQKESLNVAVTVGIILFSFWK